LLELNKIYNQDCLQGLKLLDDNSIDLTVTSPPYDNLRTYNGFSWDFEGIAKELYRVTKNGGIVVWVVGDRVKNGSETLIPFEQAQYFKKVGFNVHDTMIYQKNAMPYPEQTRYIQCFEFMFVFSKGKPKAHNLLKEKTKGYKPSKTSTQRNTDGTTTELKYEQGKKYRNRWNVWVYDVGYNKTTKDKIAFQHPAMFPEQLAQDHIISWSNEGDIVLDPFMGSGTTAKMAILNNRQYIGFELSKEYCDLANKRIENHTQQLSIGVD
jgi:DNA modification methylase